MSSDFAKELSQWYNQNKRDLPFRRNKDSYLIWISEIMLQQTRVNAMLPAYNRFINRFPNLYSLATSTESEVLEKWQGLGYYNRARNLHKSAQQMIDQGYKKVPTDFNALLSFPGIGNYTAAAISSIAEDKPHAVLDGNVKRILRRLNAEFLADSILQSKADELLKNSQIAPSTFNQAIMELGALICIPSTPKCNMCPVRNFCLSYKEGGPEYAALLTQTKKKSQIKLDVDLLIWVSKNQDTKTADNTESKFFVIENKDGIFLKNHSMFAHQICINQELQHSSGFLNIVESRLIGKFTHVIQNWKIQTKVYWQLSNDEFNGGQWLTETEVKKKLHSSYCHKAFSKYLSFAASKESM